MRRIVLAIVSVIFGLVTANAHAEKINAARQVTVKCPKQSIQDAVDRAARRRVPTTIFVRGSCDEDVTIKVDDLTIRGDPPRPQTLTDAGEIVGTIKIVGARRVTIAAIRVTGSGDGIVGTDVASFRVEKAIIEENDVAGIVVQRGSNAAIEDSTISKNGRNPPDVLFRDSGILVRDGGTASIISNKIVDNPSDGISVFDESSATITGNKIDGNGTTFAHSGIDVFAVSSVRTLGNTITDNRGPAVFVGSVSYLRNGLVIAEGAPDPADTDVIVQAGCTQGAPPGSCGKPGSFAVLLNRKSVGDFRNANITGQISVNDTSALDSRTSVISGNIRGVNLTEIFLPATVVGSGTVSCFNLSIAPAFTGCGDSLPPP